jgi:hypothetical protein
MEGEARSLGSEAPRPEYCWCQLTAGFSTTYGLLQLVERGLFDSVVDAEPAHAAVAEAGIKLNQGF